MTSPENPAEASRAPIPPARAEDAATIAASAAPVSGGVAPTPSELTPEEQMERFAQELKETDWGHQPC